MSIYDKDFVYVNAEDSRKPGYLANKFAKIKREMKSRDAEIKAEKQRVVKNIKKVAL